MSKQLVRRLIVASSLLLAVGCVKKSGSDTAAPGDTAGAASEPAGGVGSTDEIKIGEYGSMTGSEATFGTSSHHGIEMAVEEQNKARRHQREKDHPDLARQ